MTSVADKLPPLDAYGFPYNIGVSVHFIFPAGGELIVPVTHHNGSVESAVGYAGYWYRQSVWNDGRVLTLYQQDIADIGHEIVAVFT